MGWIDEDDLPASARGPADSANRASSTLVFNAIFGIAIVIWSASPIGLLIALLLPILWIVAVAQLFVNLVALGTFVFNRTVTGNERITAIAFGFIGPAATVAALVYATKLLNEY